MSKSDNDLLDSALDAAEEKLGAETPITEAPKESVKEVVEEPQAETTEPAKEEKQISDEEANVQAPTVTEVATQVAPTVTAPTSLSPKLQSLFSTASPELKAALVEEETRRQQVMGRLANDTQRAKSWETRVNSDFQKPEDLQTHRATLKLQGLNDEVDELHRYRAWNTVFKTDPLSAVHKLMADNGITLEHLNGESFSEHQQQVASDPRLDDVVNKFETFQKQQEKEKADREEAYLTSQVNTWKSGIDKYGKPRSDFASLYAPQIDNEWRQVLTQAQEIGEQLSLEQSLDRAFDNVQSKIYKAHGINPASPKPTKEQIVAVAAKTQAAVTKASGAPRTDVIAQRPKKKYKNDKEWVEAAMSRGEEKRGSAR